MESNTLLITASIDPSVFNTPYTVVIDPQIRLKEYLQNLRNALLSGIFKKVIFCENTGYIFPCQQFQDLAQTNNVSLEILSFLGNCEEINKRGKGYGDGEIIKYALQNSLLLAKAPSFYKITGRIQISNLRLIVKCHKKSDNLFILSQRNTQNVDVRFFKTGRKFYCENLLDCFMETNDSNGRYLEHVFYEKLKNKRMIKPFIIYPHFSGISGSTGKSYNISLYEYIKRQVYLLLGLLTVR